MPTHGHYHEHGSDCGHTAILHDGHVDYLHDSRLHHLRDGEIDEHALGNTDDNPSTCTRGHSCTGHEMGHKHDDSCGHEPIPHDGHMDYLVDNHLHHCHGDHCDDHGHVTLSRPI